MGTISWSLVNRFKETKSFNTSNHLSKSTYIDTLLERFAMTSCHPSPTPYASGEVSQEDLKPLEDRSLYLQIVGALIYLASITRPDIAWVVHLLSRKMSSPSVYHFQCFPVPNSLAVLRARQ